jgi:hypothetical protein
MSDPSQEIGLVLAEAVLFTSYVHDNQCRIENRVCGTAESGTPYWMLFELVRLFYDNEALGCRKAPRSHPAEVDTRDQYINLERVITSSVFRFSDFLDEMPGQIENGELRNTGFW